MLLLAVTLSMPLHGGVFRPPPPPATPAPSTPAPGAGPGPGTAPSAPNTGGAVGQDGLDWAHWWRLERDLYLWDPGQRQVRAAFSGDTLRVAGRSPVSDEAVQERIAPVLLGLLEEETSDDIRTAALVAIARMGLRLEPTGRDAARAALLRTVDDPVQEVSETAVLSLGILGDPRDAPLLVALLLESKRPGAGAARADVPARTRAFAGYGLAVLAEECEEPAVAQRIAAAAMAVLDRAEADPDVQSAAAMALGRCRLPASLRPPPADVRAGARAEAVVSRDAASRWMTERVLAREGLAPTARAHALVATARLAVGATPQARQRALEALTRATAERRLDARERAAAAIALGELLASTDEEGDGDGIDALTEQLHYGQAIERRMAMIALAHASSRPDGGASRLAHFDAARKVLQRGLASGRSSDRPWFALALGVQVHAARRAGAEPPRGTLSALRRALDGCHSASAIGAYAIGASLAGVRAETRAREAISASLVEASERMKDPSARGHIALAAGLLGVRGAQASMESAARGSSFQPALLWNASVGLSMLDVGDVTALLLPSLGPDRPSVVRGGAALAAGRVGDARVEAPLLALAEDEDAPTLPRSFAIIGLGTLAEDRPLPWRVPLAHGVPYFAPTRSLWGGGRGVLDIL
ncbi:MAG: HEAT repeat domain-containing protein [Planctomycetota bacterium]